jgi:hypothetical protein
MTGTPGCARPMVPTAAARPDCHELDWSQVRRTSEGRLELLIGGSWLPVPFEAILSIRSPDGHVHACWPASDERIRCVILPPEA